MRYNTAHQTMVSVETKQRSFGPSLSGVAIRILIARCLHEQSLCHESVREKVWWRCLSQFKVTI
jgi:hypothetical protein